MIVQLATDAAPLGFLRVDQTAGQILQQLLCLNDRIRMSANSTAMSAGSLPTKAAGMVDSATRSLSAVRSRRFSATGFTAIG